MTSLATIPGTSPSTVRPGSGLKVGWICGLGHRYKATVDARSGRGQGCPVCANLRVLQGYNDLGTTHPQIAAQWDAERNGALGPEGIVAGSKKKHHWVCARGHRYTAAPYNRVAGKGCPVCAGQKSSPA
ncbi:zinc-ribbon domain-containing protein [Georgenia sp. SUBG003]|uniref:zinc-ribbon domain-containing protein n=1 Tax=Georgenia sp. SUBG003 TaxID=1497974 RepID=UPI003AB7C7FE